MSTLEEQIEKAFDLSFLNFPKYPSTKIRTIGILGGGTAGYLAALALKKLHPNINTSVIESSKIPVIGVGESTTTEIVPFLHKTLGINPSTFFREVKPTLKLGIRFEWGCPGDYHFNFNFFAGHQQESYFFENSILNSNWPSVLMDNRKIPIVRDENGVPVSLLGSIPFSYHIDNKNLIRFLRTQLLEKSINIVDKEIIKVNLDEGGSVSSLEADDKSTHSFDLYIDCSGFHSKILGQALKTEFQSFKSTLINDKALTFDLPSDAIIEPFTSVITMKNGWCWKIPMRNENHFGYVYSTQFCNEQTALEEVQSRFGPIRNHKSVDFKTGRHKMAWNKNVLALGNAYGFLEPLESTAIQTAVHSIMTLCKLMPNSLQDYASIAGINHEIAAPWDTFRWFLGMHFKFNKHLTTPYWSWCNEQTEIGDAKMILDLFKQRPPLSSSNFGTLSPYTALESLVFNSYSYDTLIYGQKIFASNEHPKMTKAAYLERVQSYNLLTQRALTQNELFADEFLIEQEILEPLFGEPDTWINETEA